MIVVSRSDTIAGAQNHVLALVEHLQSRDWEVAVAADGRGPFMAAATARGAGYFSVPGLSRARHALRSAKAVTKIASQFRPQLISCHSTVAGIIGRIAAHRLGIPSVFTIHGWAFSPGTPRIRGMAVRFLERRMRRITSHYIAVSEYDRALGVREVGIDRGDISAIHNGVRSCMREANGRHDPPHIIMIGRFEDQKDHETLLRALIPLKPFAWRLTLAGTGPRHVAMKARFVDEFGERVKAPGFLDDLDALYHEAHIFVLCSRYEGLPLTIIEAMMHSLPVVASDVGGCNELVRHGETGFLTPAGDDRAVTMAIRELLSNQRKREEFGASARRLATTHFTQDLMAKQTEHLFDNLISMRRISGA